MSHCRPEHPVLAPGHTLALPSPPQAAPSSQAPQSSKPPQPLPIVPQYWPPPSGRHANGVQPSVVPHTFSRPPPPQVQPPSQPMQSSTPPQPSPITPQNLPPLNSQVSGWQFGGTHTLFWHTSPAGHSPQSSESPQPSPTTPQ